MNDEYREPYMREIVPGVKSLACDWCCSGTSIAFCLECGGCEDCCHGLHECRNQPTEGIETKERSGE
jgi:hypothetical protein